MKVVDVAHWNLSGPAAEAMPGAGAVLRPVHIKAGHVAARHSHPHEQFFVVMTGGGTLQCETGAVTLSPGTAVRLAPGAWHSAEFSADTVLAEFNLSDPTAA